MQVADRLLVQNDGPMLEALKRLTVEKFICRAVKETSRIGSGWRSAMNASRRRPVKRPRTSSETLEAVRNIATG